MRSFEAGSAKIRILDDGVFVTDAGNLFGGSKKAKIKGAMRPVLVETGDNLVLLDAGFGPELPEILVDRYELRRDEDLMDNLMHSTLNEIAAWVRSAELPEPTHDQPETEAFFEDDTTQDTEPTQEHDSP